MDKSRPYSSNIQLLTDSSKLDMAFTLDCTGSMGPYIQVAQDNISQIVEEIANDVKQMDIRLALVEYRDHPPQEATFTTRTHGFTNSVIKMKEWLDCCVADGGGDEPEALADALHEVLGLSWRMDSIKICVLISDAPPHGLISAGDGFPNGCPAGINPMEVAYKMGERGIALYSVGCEPTIGPYKDFFMALSYITSGQYVPLTDADFLTEVVIGSVQEELSLEQWMSEVNDEVRREIEAGKTNDGDDDKEEEAISKRVIDKLDIKRAISNKLTRNNEALSTATEFAKRLASLKSMADVKKIFNENNKTVTSNSDERAYKRTNRPTPGRTDTYEVRKGRISYEQARRMVKRSKMRLMWKE